MTNWNLETFENIFANLSQSTYTGRPLVFDYARLGEADKKRLGNVYSIEFNFSKDVTYKKSVTQGGSNLPNDGVVYLQPDKSLTTVEETTSLQVPNPNGGYRTEKYVTSTYQKGLLTDEKEGFNTYYLSDTEKIDSSTKQTYFAIRGSDGIRLETLNDWLGNNARFAVGNQYVPQAKLAHKAMKEKITELNAQAPDAVMNVTGHSLGTIVSAQAVANLSYKELESVGEVVLFNGPDVSDSLAKMDGVTARKIREAGKHITYYVNPLDMVSMLNREKPWDEQFGKVNVIVPSEYTSTFDSRSSHDFGAFQMDSYGNFLVASETYHPELLKAGQDLAKLEKKYLKKLLGDHYDSDNLYQQVAGVMSGDAKKLVATLAGLGIAMTVAEAKKIYDDFQKEYQEIIDTAKKEGIAWSRNNISSYHGKIQASSGSQRIKLRTELIYMAAQLAEADISEKVEVAKSHISDMKETIDQISASTISSAFSIGLHLNPAEIDSLTSEITMATVWNEGIETANIEELQQYQTKLMTFTANLTNVAQNLTAVDQELSEDIVANLA
ncbi:cutinase family protein [Streptococcus pluranimalium]|uniref:Uncharacterized protein n=1 Tax=Streptococcus pluranimalium TaxID=82348 RepID=A0A2L0D3D8_9STRE|nr:cutinase family protein [Streptococcus pluranimalium]AUW96129.1 hypothetical protein C0J00_02800 [Streptococcus pluranimalium]